MIATLHTYEWRVAVVGASTATRLLRVTVSPGSVSTTRAAEAVRLPAAPRQSCSHRDDMDSEHDSSALPWQHPGPYTGMVYDRPIDLTTSPLRPSESRMAVVSCLR